MLSCAKGLLARNSLAGDNSHDPVSRGAIIISDGKLLHTQHERIAGFNIILAGDPDIQEINSFIRADRYRTVSLCLQNLIGDCLSLVSLILTLGFEVGVPDVLVIVALLQSSFDILFCVSLEFAVISRCSLDSLICQFFTADLNGSIGGLLPSAYPPAYPPACQQPDEKRCFHSRSEQTLP